MSSENRMGPNENRIGSSEIKRKLSENRIGWSENRILPSENGLKLSENFESCCNLVLKPACICFLHFGRMQSKEIFWSNAVKTKKRKLALVLL